MENLVYHYTSLDALRSILGNEVCLWATHYRHLNDPSEQIWAEKYVLKAIKESREYLNYSIKDLKGWLGKEAYILSLCNNADDRNMWRLYCDDGKGVCLVLDKDILMSYCNEIRANNPKDYFCIVEDVEYSTIENIHETVEICLKKSCFNIMDEERESELMRVVPFIKNADFTIEAELRCAIIRETDIVSIPYDNSTGGPGTPIFHTNEKGRKFRMRGKQLVPYIEIKLPVEALKGIILGYNVAEKEAKEYVSNIIENFGTEYKDLWINKSERFSTCNQKDYFNKITEE